MTSRFDRLIRKHDTQQKRRIIPGLTLAAATIVAVGLFLATTINTQAAVRQRRPVSLRLARD
ncbi:MAG: hypothetical protein OXT70_04770 [Chloroflexota bacterium]|nr:hypothetical protein [Chloroflexota bacterium]